MNLHLLATFSEPAQIQVILNGYKKWGINVLEKLNVCLACSFDSEKEGLC